LPWQGRGVDAKELEVAEIEEVEKDGLIVEVGRGRVAEEIDAVGGGGVEGFGREGGDVGFADAAEDEPELAAGEAAVGVAAEAEVFAVFLDEEAVDIFGEDAVGGDVLPGQEGGGGEEQQEDGHTP